MRYTMMCHRERGDCGMINASWSMMMWLGMIVLGLMISCEVSAREIQGVMYASTTEQRHSNFAKEHNKLHLTEGFGEVSRSSSSSSTSSSSDGASGDNSGSWAASGHGHHHHNQFNSKVGSNQLTVSKTGNANFNNIQAAIDSIPVNNAQWVQITIAAGVYREKVVIPYNKPYIVLQGAGITATMLTYSETASMSGTADSATFTVWAPNFIARGIGFQNAAPPANPGAVNGQAVAVLLAADKAAFYGCGMYGGQDTLFDYAGRHYFKDCYIEGTIDFIFGDAQSVFKNCELHAMAQDSYISGSLTAQKRSSPNENTGFAFIDCKITGTGQVYLGRAWGPYSRTVYINTYMDNIIIPAGWQDWGSTQRQKTVYYGQYKCSGPGSNQMNRVAWSHELSDSEAAQFMQLSWIDGQTWLQQT